MSKMCPSTRQYLQIFLDVIISSIKLTLVGLTITYQYVWLQLMYTHGVYKLALSLQLVQFTPSGKKEATPEGSK